MTENENNYGKEKKMKVLSLFDGISGGRVALERAGIPVECYYASEIDKYAITVAQKNYPDTIQLGDINTIDFKALAGKIDLIIGGSPCQDLSVAKKNREGLSGKRSGLFWKFVEAVETIKPKYFLLENVASMSQENKDIISKALGVQPVLINSALVSAQQRKRLYWFNWTVSQPQDKGILLQDILESGEAWGQKGYCLTANYNGALFPHDFLRRQRQMVAEPLHIKENTIKGYAEINQGEGFGNQRTNGVAVPCALRNRGEGKKPEFNGTDKANALTTVQTDSMVCEPFRLGTLPNLGTGQANRIYSVKGKSVFLNALGGGGGAKTGLYKIDLPDGDYTIRKLTPIECERLQTLTNTKKLYTIEVCLDHQKNFVSVDDKNLNLQNAALPNVQVFIGENQLVIRYQEDILLNASFADLLKKFPHQRPIENFALLFVLIDIIKGKEILNGKVELHQKEISLTQANSGNVAVKLFGKEITPLAEYAEKDMIILEKLLNATTSSRLNIKNTEQTLKTLFYYVASVIVSFIPKEIQRNCILEIQTETGYTFGISNTQRYKAIGNGWTVDVIAYILGGLE